MIVKQERPPIWNRACEVFGLENVREALFCWGGVIYNPAGVKIPAPIFVHEEVHARQQAKLGGPEPWWERYFVDQKFRLEQELEAHRAEYKAACEMAVGMSDMRTRRRMFLHNLASRLASPVYGRMIAYDRARGLIKAP